MIMFRLFLTWEIDFECQNLESFDDFYASVFKLYSLLKSKLFPRGWIVMISKATPGKKSNIKKHGKIHRCITNTSDVFTNLFH